MLRALYSLLFFFPLLLTAQTEYTLTEALQKQLVKFRVEGGGGHTGQSLVLHLEKLSNKNLSVRIPAGQTFLPADSSTQALILVKEALITFAKPKVFMKAFGLCIEAHDGSPGAGETFSLGEMAAGPLLELAKYISKNQLYREGDAQSAIWCITDSMPVATIGHRGLLATTCQLLGQPLPEYKINTSPTPPARTQAQERRPALVYEPLSVEGEFEYQSNVERTINVYVIDAAGNKVRTIFENQKHPPGWARYSFYFQTTKLPRGTYEVCLDDGVKIVKKIRVRY